MFANLSKGERTKLVFNALAPLLGDSPTPLDYWLLTQATHDALARMEPSIAILPPTVQQDQPERAA